MKKQFLFLLIFVPIWAFPFSSKDMAAKDLKKLQKNGVILIEKDNKDSVWPEITIYQKIDATPLEAGAIFMAFDHQKNYVKDVTKSKVIKMDSPTTIIVEYERNNPWPIADEHYTNIHHIKELKNGYYIKWSMLTSNLAEKVEGDAYFVKWKGKTLLKYRIEVYPKLKLAGMFTGTMIKETKEGIQGIIDYIVYTKSFEAALMKKYKDMLENSVNGKWSYKKLIK